LEPLHIEGYCVYLRVRCDFMTTVQDIRNKVKMFRPTSQEVNLFDPNLNDKSTRLFKFKDDQDNKFKVWVFTETIKLETPLTTSLIFSINFPDNVCLAKKLLFTEYGIGEIFAVNSKDDQIHLCIKLLKDNLKSLNFDLNEGLTVYRNSLQLTLKQNRQILPEIVVFKKIKSLIELHFPDEPYETDYSDLPIDLRQLLLKLKSFVIRDDFERGELIKGLSTKQRTDLIKLIGPKIGEINLFLDKFGDKPLTEGAIGLQCLAELTTEITNDRNKNHS
jgi:hypothetical protein